MGDLNPTRAGSGRRRELTESHYPTSMLLPTHNQAAPSQTCREPAEAHGREDASKVTPESVAAEMELACPLLLCLYTC